VRALRVVARAAAARDPRIVRVLLFGSLVHGVPTPHSDADVLVVLREAPARRPDRVGELLQVFTEAPLPLDLHAYTLREWRAALHHGEPLACVARDGIDLLATDG
jgi:predicted nucleotidyltransferase